ncbi:MAG: hypothetical protein HQL25_03595 [Candidatus Omnitrophica bacterium]|nr:hypothetical protein [Candidatus Omnitrophota bacterium]
MKKNRAQSISEIMLLLALLAGVMMLMQKYVLRSFMGRMKTAADQVGYGRQYDKEKTTTCVLDVKTNSWKKVDGTGSCNP